MVPNKALRMLSGFAGSQDVSCPQMTLTDFSGLLEKIEYFPGTSLRATDESGYTKQSFFFVALLSASCYMNLQRKEIFLEE